MQKQNGVRSNVMPRFRGAAVLGLCGLALGGCVSQGKYDALMRERNSLAGQKKSLEQNVAANQIRMESASAELASVKAKVAQQDAMLADQQSKLSIASSQLDGMRAQAADQEAMFAKLQAGLSNEIQSQKLSIRQMKNGISLDLPEDALFSSGSAALNRGGRDLLAKVSEQLKDANYQIVVSGFTDHKPITGKLARRYPSNWDLAAARATTVVRLLEANQVPASRLIAASYGENNPAGAGDTDANDSQKNGRIEIHLRPIGQE